MAQKNKEPIGAAVRTLREDLGLSLRDVEARSSRDVKASHLAQVERGQISEPSLSLLRALAKAFELPFNQFLEKLGLLAPTDVGEVLTWDEMVLLSTWRDLEPDELEQAQSYLNWIRSQRTE